MPIRYGMFVALAQHGQLLWSLAFVQCVRQSAPRRLADVLAAPA
jgi:hypothetical protein